MGTSKSIPTPQGGGWTTVKSDISGYISGGGSVTPAQIIGSTVSAGGGLSLSSPSGNSGQRGGSGGGQSGVSSVPRTRRGGGSSVARAASGLAGFGGGLQSGGLAQALTRLGIEDLRGRSAGEVISRISDHLSEDLQGLEREVIQKSVQDAILNAAELSGDPTYENLESSLQNFLAREGIEGLLELFLAQYVFSRVWLFIEDYVNKRTDDQGEVAGLEAAIEQACRSNVREEIHEKKQNNEFAKLDWFGVDGIRVAQTIVADLEQRFREAAQGGAK